MKTKKQPLDKSQLKRMAMQEWKDGQPGCMVCIHELKIGSPVYQDQETHLIYCAPCVEKK